MERAKPGTLAPDEIRKKDALLQSFSQKRDQALRAGDLAAALSACQSALMVMPENPTITSDIAAILTMQGRHEEAVATACKALDLGDRSFRSLDTLAHSNGALGRWDEAALWGRRALEQRDARLGTARNDVLHDPSPVAMPPPPSLLTRDRNVIAFSLFGDLPKYCEMAVFNAIDQPDIYPGWTCHFHVDERVPGHVIRRLESAGAIIIRVDRRHADIPGTMWRYLSYDTPGLHRIVFRDADCIISMREKSAVDEWVQSGRQFHTMRDAQSHTELLLGGLWGCVGGALPPMAGLIAKSTAKDTQTGRFTDQYFLREMVWPFARQSLLTHDSIFGFMSPRQFPDGPRRDDIHVGGSALSSIDFNETYPEGATIEWSCFRKDDLGRPICTYRLAVATGRTVYIPRRLAMELQKGTLLIRTRVV